MDNLKTEKEFLISFDMSEKKSNFYSSETVIGTFKSDTAPFTLKLVGFNNRSHNLVFFISFCLIILSLILVDMDILTTNSRAKDILLLIIILILFVIFYFFLKPHYLIFRNRQLKNGMILNYCIQFSDQDITRDKEFIFSIGDLRISKIDKLKKQRVMNNQKQLNDFIDCLLIIPGVNESITWRIRFIQWSLFPKSTKKIIILPKIKRNNTKYSFN